MSHHNYIGAAAAGEAERAAAANLSGGKAAAEQTCGKAAAEPTGGAGGACAHVAACGASAHVAACGDGATLRLLFVGDICGNIGVDAAKAWLPRLRAEHGVDVCVANAENSAQKGVGCSRGAADTLYSCGVDVITLGNHAWNDRDATKLLDEDRRVVRPANYPPENPGMGSTSVRTSKGLVGVVNVMGQLFMDAVDCPFRALDRELSALGKAGASDPAGAAFALGGFAAIIVDMHAEATSEKAAFAYHADGRVSCVIGTHTHVQTADEHVLGGGTAFISDAGMTGPADGVIGTDREASMRRFLTRMPSPFLPAKGRRQINAVIVDVDPRTGKATGIKRIFKVEG